jgi:hypothetical protein
MSADQVSILTLSPDILVPVVRELPLGTRCCVACTCRALRSVVPLSYLPYKKALTEWIRRNRRAFVVTWTWCQPIGCCGVDQRDEEPEFTQFHIDATRNIIVPGNSAYRYWTEEELVAQTRVLLREAGRGERYLIDWGPDCPEGQYEVENTHYRVVLNPEFCWEGKPAWAHYDEGSLGPTLRNCLQTTLRPIPRP